MPSSSASWSNVMTDIVKQTKIRALNDALRKTGKGGQILQTSGFASLNSDIRAEFISMLRSRDEFDPDNDPYGTHEFGSEKIGSQVIFWKIDTYALDMVHLSEAPDDPKRTKRVMKVMLAREY